MTPDQLYLDLFLDWIHFGEKCYKKTKHMSLEELRRIVDKDPDNEALACIWLARLKYEQMLTRLWIKVQQERNTN